MNGFECLETRYFSLHISHESLLTMESHFSMQVLWINPTDPEHRVGDRIFPNGKVDLLNKGNNYVKRVHKKICILPSMLNVQIYFCILFLSRIMNFHKSRKIFMCTTKHQIQVPRVADSYK